MRGLANRNKEFQLFERMILGQARGCILLLEGPSERGKSVLLSEFSALAEEKLGKRCCARVDLKGGLTLDAVFSRLCAELGSEIFPTYRTLPNAVPVQCNIDANLSGAKMGNKNRVAVRPVIGIRGGSSVQRCSDALFQDLQSCTKPLVLIIDTFEAAIDDVSKWIIQQLLPTATRRPQLYVVVAGQRVPNRKDSPLTWGQCAVPHILHPVISVDDWYEYACSRYPAFPRHHIESICKGLADRPSIINEFIDNVARQLAADNANGGTV